MDNKRNNFFIFKIIWGALFAAVFIHSFLSYKLRGPFLSPLSVDFSNMFTQILYIVAVVAFILSFVIPDFFLNKFKMQYARSRSQTETDPNASLSYDLLQKYFSLIILKFALVESIAVMGLVLSLVVHENHMLFFLILSVIGFAIHFPSDIRIKSDTDLR